MCDKHPFKTIKDDNRDDLVWSLLFWGETIPTCFILLLAGWGAVDLAFIVLGVH